LGTGFFYERYLFKESGINAINGFSVNGVLVGRLLDQGIPSLGIVSDDAGQFNVLIMPCAGSIQSD
jgi:hypothetical protein